MRAWSLAAAALALACSGGRPRAPMSEGEHLYRSKCSACHRLYEPSAYPKQKWVESVDEMIAKKRVRLTADERAEILQYLTGDASTGLATTPAPMGKSP